MPVNLDAWTALARAVLDEDAAALRENDGNRDAARARSEGLVRRRAEAERTRAEHKALGDAVAALEELAREEPAVEKARLELRLAEAASGVDADAAFWAEASGALEERERDAARAKALLGDLRSKRPALSAALEASEARRAQAQAAEVRAAAIREQIPRYQDIEGMDRGIADAQKARDDADRDAQTASKEEARIKRLKEDATAEREALSGAEGALGALEALLDGAQRRAASLEALRRALAAFEAGAPGLFRAQEAAGAALSEAEARAKAYRRLYNAFQRGQAGLMAAALEEGEPCPVCGATHHPQKAPLSDETPTQAQVEAAEADAARARTGAENAVSAAKVLKAERDKEWERLEADWQRCHEDDPAAGAASAPSARAAEAARAQRAQLGDLLRRKAGAGAGCGSGCGN